MCRFHGRTEVIWSSGTSKSSDLDLSIALLTLISTCVMHRAGKGTFAGKYKRDLRRTTVHDSSSQAWGLNGVNQDARPGFQMPTGVL